MPELEKKHDSLLDALKASRRAIVSDDDAAIESVILEIRAGVGERGRAVCRDLYEMYLRYCCEKGTGRSR